MRCCYSLLLLHRARRRSCTRRGHGRLAGGRRWQLAAPCRQAASTACGPRASRRPPGARMRPATWPRAGLGRAPAREGGDARRRCHLRQRRRLGAPATACAPRADPARRAAPRTMPLAAGREGSRRTMMPTPPNPRHRRQRPDGRVGAAANRAAAQSREARPAAGRRARRGATPHGLRQRVPCRAATARRPPPRWRGRGLQGPAQGSVRVFPGSSCRVFELSRIFNIEVPRCPEALQVLTGKAR